MRKMIADNIHVIMKILTGGTFKVHKNTHHLVGLNHK